MREFTKSLIIRIKGENYSIDQSIPTSYLVRLGLKRLFMAFRGFVKFRQIVFVEERVRIYGQKFISIGKGSTLGSYSKLYGLSAKGIRIGKNVNIGANSVLKCTGTLEQIGEGITIERNVGLGHNCYLGGHGGIRIKQNTIVGENFTVHSDNHIYTESKKLIRHQGTVKLPVEIGANCWIGSNVTLLGGVNVGSNCVIGAGSVVTKSFPNGSILYGVPAKAKNNH